MTAAFAQPEPGPLGALPLDAWVVVAEFAHPDDSRRFELEELDALIGELWFWRPLGLWAEDRYAVQLHIEAASFDRAMRGALDCHRHAARAFGLTPGMLLRIEVLTAEELERGWDETEPDSSGAARNVGYGVSPQTYEALRRLVAATTAAEVTEVVDGFVTAIGAQLRPGVASHRPGATSLDIDLVGGTVRHATAEAFSVAGLLVEHALPDVLDDAGLALRRLQRRQQPAADMPARSGTDFDGGEER